MDSSASGRVGPHELIEGDIRGADLDLRDPRLRGTDPLAALLLREAAGLALTPDGESQGQPQLDELALFSGEPEKIRRLAHPPAGTTFRVGHVVSVEFPFTDMQGRKRQPRVVLAGDASDLLLAQTTTHEPRDSFDVPLDDWTIAGLPKPSTVRLMKLASLDVRLIHHTIGKVAAGGRTKLAQAIERMGLQIAQAIRQ